MGLMVATIYAAQRESYVTAISYMEKSLEFFVGDEGITEKIEEFKTKI